MEDMTCAWTITVTSQHYINLKFLASFVHYITDCLADFVEVSIENLVNSKYSGLEVLFRIISSLKYREVEIKKIYIHVRPKLDYYQMSFVHVKETSLCVGNVSIQ